MGPKGMGPMTLAMGPGPEGLDQGVRVRGLVPGGLNQKAWDRRFGRADLPTDVWTDGPVEAAALKGVISFRHEH